MSKDYAGMKEQFVTRSLHLPAPSHILRRCIREGRNDDLLRLEPGIRDIPHDPSFDKRKSETKPVDFDKRSIG